MRRFTFRALGIRVGWIAAFVAGCIDLDMPESEPLDLHCTARIGSCLRTSTTAVDFGQIPQASAATGLVHVTTCGPMNTAICDLRMESDETFDVSVVGDVRVPFGASATIGVSALGTSPRLHTGVLRFESSDPERPAVEIPVRVTVVR